MAITNRSLPLMIDVEGHPYLIEAGEVDFLPSGVPAPENIYPQLAPSWEAPGPVLPVEHGETMCIQGRRFLVNMIGDLELVALALPGESEHEAPAAPAPAANPDFGALVADLAAFAAAMVWIAGLHTPAGADPAMLPPLYRSDVDPDDGGAPNWSRLAARGRQALERLAEAV